MGLVGPGFVGMHHIDAVRRLGFVDVVAVADGNETLAREQGRRHRGAEGVRVVRGAGGRPRRRRHSQHDAQSPARAGDPRGDRPPEAHHLREAALLVSDRSPRALERRDRRRHRSRGDVQLPGQPAGAAGARRDRTGRHRTGPFRPGRISAGLAPQADGFSWRLEPEKGGASSAFADIGSHWCDLAQHVIGSPIVEVLADLATVVH